MFKQNTSNLISGGRRFYCKVVNGIDDGKGDDPPADGTNADDLLKGLNLSAEELAAVKANPSLLKVIDHQVKAKRDANNEAKAYREKLEKADAEKALKDKEALAKKGEFETLYKQSEEKLSAKDLKIRDVVIQKDVAILATQLGLKKTSYLKLLDTANLEVDLETLSVKDAEKIVKKFKEENPDFFDETKKIDVDNKKPKIKDGEIPEDDEIKALETQAKKTRLPRDIAAWQRAVKEKQK